MTEPTEDHTNHPLGQGLWGYVADAAFPIAGLGSVAALLVVDRAHFDAVREIEKADDDAGAPEDSLPKPPWAFRGLVIVVRVACIVWELYEETVTEGSDKDNHNWVAAVTTLLVALGLTCAEVAALKEVVPQERITQARNWLRDYSRTGEGAPLLPAAAGPAAAAGTPVGGGGGGAADGGAGAASG